ncbi:hypothetical protein C1W84_32325 [Burkholderia pseudomallei]|nr:hypothetical protein [Burkholderia pseudomallei]MWA34220.1 hypothetical protein [Burkholderia pseudomallei]NAX61961.1 hypothetical protein [Burkholderia pseudomallei]NAX78349.1 hypothetical protein [Burkholderia pseudomallei]NAX91385.1 hypothetical protein [Burkholderia pseudomallei]
MQKSATSVHVPESLVWVDRAMNRRCAHAPARTATAAAALHIEPPPRLGNSQAECKVSA